MPGKMKTRTGSKEQLKFPLRPTKTMLQRVLPSRRPCRVARYPASFRPTPPPPPPSASRRWRRPARRRPSSPSRPSRSLVRCRLQTQTLSPPRIGDGPHPHYQRCRRAVRVQRRFGPCHSSVFPPIYRFGSSAFLNIPVSSSCQPTPLPANYK